MDCAYARNGRASHHPRDRAARVRREQAAAAGDGIGKAIKNFKRGINHDDDIDVTPSDKRVAADAASRTGAGLDDAKVRDAEVIEGKAGKS
jgi:hypothetical protein